MVGPYGAGKTCLLSRFISGAFSEDYHMTLSTSSST
jgi:GTPase SAR1 family protein